MITDKIYIYTVYIYIYRKVDVFIPPFFPRKAVVIRFRVLGLAVTLIERVREDEGVRRPPAQTHQPIPNPN